MFFSASLLLLLSVSSCCLAAGGAGGYSTINPADVDQSVKDVAFASLETGTGSSAKIQIIEAEKQVVAGINYRLKVEVVDGSTNKICVVTVYVDLQGKTKATVESCVA